MTAHESPFLDIPASEHVASNTTTFAIRDRYPVNAGHTLVIPRRPVASWFDMDSRERTDALALIDQVCADLRASHQPDGFNIGINDGAAAGQTVFHAHVHVIPRYAGDMPDPRGGVRHVIPDRSNYLLRSEEG